MNENGNFKEPLQEDVEGLLSLCETSLLGVKGETIIHEAMDLSCARSRNLEKNGLRKKLTMKVDRALDMPSHWRPNRLVVKWFMDVYGEEPDMHSTLLKLAT